MIFVGAIPKLDKAVYLSPRFSKYDIPSLSIPLNYYSLFVRALYLDAHITSQSIELLLSFEQDLREYGDRLDLRVLESIAPPPLHRVIRRIRGYFFGRGGTRLPIITGLEHISLVSLLFLLGLKEGRAEDVVIDCRPLKGHYEIPFDLRLLRGVVGALETRFKVHLVVDSVYSLNEEVVLSDRADKTAIRVLMSRPKFCRDLMPNDMVYVERCLPERRQSEIRWLKDERGTPLYREPKPLDYIGLAFGEWSERVRDVLDELFEASSSTEQTVYSRLVGSGEDLVDKSVGRRLLYKLYRYGFVEPVQAPGGRVVTLSEKGMEAVLYETRGGG
mgnify:CR=1 FL=1